MQKEEFKSGFVSILGKPNVGKSTLLNKLLKQKVSIVSPKPQTTRNNITGILNGEDYQIVFLDTPGIHKTKNSLDDYMQKSINASVKDVDVILYLLDANKNFNDELESIETYSKICPLILLVNKIDEVNFQKLFPKMAGLNSLSNVKEIVPISAIKGDNVDEVVKCILKYLPEGPMYYSKDDVTDKTEQFMASEIIREKSLWLLQDEIPHGIAVQIEEFKEEDDLDRISATIFVEKESHKNIVIGSKGSMLKKIGEASRKELERMLDKKVFLSLWVKVKEKWRESDLLINNLGYNKKDIQ